MLTISREVKEIEQEEYYKGIRNLGGISYSPSSRHGLCSKLYTIPTRIHYISFFQVTDP